MIKQADIHCITILCFFSSFSIESSNGGGFDCNLYSKPLTA